MLKQNFADQLKAQSDVWKAQVRDYQERFEQMGEKAREDYKKAMEQMEAKAEEARQMADRVRGANESARFGSLGRRPADCVTSTWFSQYPDATAPHFLPMCTAAYCRSVLGSDRWRRGGRGWSTGI